MKEQKKEISLRKMKSLLNKAVNFFFNPCNKHWFVSMLFFRMKPMTVEISDPNFAGCFPLAE